MTRTESSDQHLEEEIGAYAGRLFEMGLGALEAITVALGRELGLYAQLAAPGGMTPVELATHAGIHPRYAREWLEQQAAAGLIDVQAAGDGPDQRRFALSAAGQECLLRPESLSSTGPLLDLIPVSSRVLPALVEAFRTGAGIPYSEYGIHDVQGDFNRPAFVNLLAAEWLPAVPGLADRLAAGRARVAEIGSGEGWAAISVARAWPQVEVDAFDNDEASVATAREHASAAGVDDRVRFEAVDVTRELPAHVQTGAYDVVLAFEMIHDLARPQAALATMRRLGKPDAIHLVVDERAAEEFEAPTDNPIERLLYAASVLHCLPVGLSETPSAGTGTVMRPATFRGYAMEAGFSSVSVLPIEHDLFRFYHLTV
jgi:SAM-dependent methyltransferase